MKPQQLTYEFPEMHPQERLTQLVLYIADKCLDDPTYGKTKLAKILYYSDFRSYQKYGKPITGARYVKLDNGPFPDGFNDLISQLQAERIITVKEQNAGELTRKRVVALHEPNLDLF